MTMPGLASTALLLIIFSWNEAFWSINLSNATAQPSTVAIIAVSIPIPTIVVIAMVPVRVAVIGAATDADPDISSSR